MRRKKLRLIAHLTRTALLGVGLLAAATASVWKWRPDLVDRVDAKLLRWTTGSFYQRWTDAANLMATDLPAAERALEAIVDDLPGVRRQDHMAEIAVDCMGRLSQVAEARRDLDAAIYWQKRACRFDDHSVHLDSRLGDLLCRRESTRAEGIEHLTTLWRRFPGNPWTGPLLARGLVLADRLEEAIQVIVTADQALRSNYWQIGWSESEDSPMETVGMMPTRENGELCLRFRIATDVAALTIYPPPFHSASLLSPRLEMRVGGDVVRMNLAAEVAEAPLPAGVENFQVTAATGRLTTRGESGPSIKIRPPQPIAADTEILFRANELRRPMPQLVDVLQMPELGRRLLRDDPATQATATQLRPMLIEATADNFVEVFWQGPADTAFTADRRGKRRLDTLPTATGGAFAVNVALDGKPASTLRIDLPEGLGLVYRMESVTLHTADGAHEVDVGTVALQTTNSIARDDGAFAVAGGDPYFSFAVADGPLAITKIVIVGSIR